jgi:hypothetical protein
VLLQATLLHQVGVRAVFLIQLLAVMVVLVVVAVVEVLEKLVALVFQDKEILAQKALIPHLTIPHLAAEAQELLDWRHLLMEILEVMAVRVLHRLFLVRL